MKCERCKKNAATVHYTEISKVNGKSQRVETHLCEECARQTGAVKPAALAIPAITGLVQAAAGASVVERIPKEHAELKCPDCGLGYPEFRAKTRFGCARIPMSSTSITTFNFPAVSPATGRRLRSRGRGAFPLCPLSPEGPPRGSFADEKIGVRDQAA